jgi:hypothetical protein
MEGMLGKFQSDLGNISSEIRSLQEQSSSMSVRLKNRRTVQQRLETFIEHVSIPPQLIFGIVQVCVCGCVWVWCWWGGVRV